MKSIYVDGIDGIGKTTYCYNLAKQTGRNKVVHNGRPKHPTRVGIILKYMFQIMFSRNTVFDRSWYSQWVYGILWDAGPVIKIKDVEFLNRFARKHDVEVEIYEALSTSTDDGICKIYDRMSKAAREKGEIPLTIDEFDASIRLFNVLFLTVQAGGVHRKYTECTIGESVWEKDQKNK